MGFFQLGSLRDTLCLAPLRSDNPRMQGSTDTLFPINLLYPLCPVHPVDSVGRALYVVFNIRRYPFRRCWRLILRLSLLLSLSAGHPPNIFHSRRFQPGNRSWTHPSVRLAHCLPRCNRRQDHSLQRGATQPGDVPGGQSGVSQSHPLGRHTRRQQAHLSIRVSRG
jgi:hypothetical protein